MPYSTGCSTPLSNFEANLAYKDATDPTVVVAFPLVDEPGQFSHYVQSTTNILFNLYKKMHSSPINQLQNACIERMYTNKILRIFRRLFCCLDDHPLDPPLQPRPLRKPRHDLRKGQRQEDRRHLYSPREKNCRDLEICRPFHHRSQV